MTSCCSEYRENTARQKEIAGSSDCGRGNRVSALAVEVDAATTRRKPQHRPIHFITTPRGIRTPPFSTRAWYQSCRRLPTLEDGFWRPGRRSALAGGTVEAASPSEDAASDRSAAGHAGLPGAIVDAEGPLELAGVAVGVAVVEQRGAAAVDRPAEHPAHRLGD